MIASPTTRMPRNKLIVSVLTGAAYAAFFGQIAGTAVAFAETPDQQAWEMLRSGVSQKNTGKRVQAVRALRLLPRDSEATEMAEAALRDHDPKVRAAAAAALGLMASKEAIPALKNALSDKKPAVVLAAAHSLQLLHDPAGDQVYYELLTGERKASESLIAEQMDTLKDKKKMAELALEQGLGFVPFADEGYDAIKTIRKHDASSPVRASAARDLVKDTDSRVDQALVRAMSDKNWMVRASALLAIANRENPEMLTAVIPKMCDKNHIVRFTAAAAVIRLTTVVEGKQHLKDPSHLLGCKSNDPGGVNALSVTKTRITTN